MTLLAGVTLVAVLEAHAVRQDHNAMRQAYGSFLAKRVGGRPLVERIERGSLAVFRTSRGTVACSITGD